MNRKKVLLMMVFVAVIALAVVPQLTMAAIVDNGDGTKSDSFAGITVTVPKTYSYCIDAPTSDEVRVTGLTGTGYKLVGWIQVSYVLLDGSKVPLYTISVNTTEDFSQTLVYDSPWQWPVAADYGNNILTKEIHVGLAFEVLSPSGEFVYTFGPDPNGGEGLGWDVFCTGYFPPPPPPPNGFNGCTPGYWKNHPERWIPQQSLTLFNVFNTNAYNLGSRKLMDALRFRGGRGELGAAYILYRAAAAAYLNSVYIDYLYGTGTVVNQVNAALASGNRETMLSLAALLDLANNFGCPLN